ncbi:MAG: alpha/beta hydrolase family protein [Planctomycetota bacterium]
MGAVRGTARGGEGAPYLPGKHKYRTLEFPLLADEARDNRRVPVKVLFPENAKGPFPLMVLSHGGAGNWDAMLFDAQHLASHGYVVFCLEHVRSNSSTVKRFLAANRPYSRAKMIAALQKITKDPEAVLQRPRDVSFAIDQAVVWNRRHDDLRGLIDTRKIGVAGHSYGAYTTLVVCGAQPILDHLEPKVGKGRGLAGDLGDDRVAFGFAMSPQSPGTTFFGPESYRTMRRPVFCLSGSRDDQKSKDGTIMPAADRLDGFKLMPPGKARLLWLENADHFSFAYNPKAFLFPSPGRKDTERIAKAMMLLNSNWFLKRDVESRKLITPEYAKSLCGKVVTEVTWLKTAAEAEALQKKLAGGS